MSTKEDLRIVVAPGKRIFENENKPIMIKCPWHDDQHASLAVYSDHCYCFGCQKYVHASEWLGKPMPLPKVKERIDTSPPSQPMSKDIARKYHANLGKKKQWYLDRGLSDSIIDSQLLGYYNNTFTIPVWHPSGELLTVRFRRDDSISQNGVKYWGVKGRNNTLLYNQEALRWENMEKYGHHVVICEGELDCLRLWQEGIPAVSSTNGVHGFQKLWKRYRIFFEGAWRIFIAFDQDEEGKKEAVRLSKIIGRRALVLTWDIGFGKDITELAYIMGIEYIKGSLIKS